MTFKVHLLDVGEQYEQSFAQELIAVTTKAAEEAIAELKVDEVDIVLCDYTGLADAETGLGGYCPTQRMAFIAVDPHLAPLTPGWQEILRGTVSHELHHARRWQGPGYGRRLIEEIISEGLATAYEEDVLGHIPPHGLPYPGSEDTGTVDDWWERLRPHVDSTDQFGRWQFGEQDIPRWMGYRLGREAARRYFRATGTDPVSSVDIAAEDVAAAWGT